MKKLYFLNSALNFLFTEKPVLKLLLSLLLFFIGKNIKSVFMMMLLRQPTLL